MQPVAPGLHIEVEERLGTKSRLAEFQHITAQLCIAQLPGLAAIVTMASCTCWLAHAASFCSPVGHCAATILPCSCPHLQTAQTAGPSGETMAGKTQLAPLQVGVRPAFSTTVTGSEPHATRTHPCRTRPPAHHTAPGSRRGCAAACGAAPPSSALPRKQWRPPSPAAPQMPPAGAARHVRRPPPAGHATLASSAGWSRLPAAVAPARLPRTGALLRAEGTGGVWRVH